MGKSETRVVWTKTRVIAKFLYWVSNTYKNESRLSREYGFQKRTFFYPVSCELFLHKPASKTAEPAIIFPAFMLRILVSSELVFPSLLILLVLLFRQEEEQRILDTYEPILLQDSDSDPEGMQDVPTRTTVNSRYKQLLGIGKKLLIGRVFL